MDWRQEREREKKKKNRERCEITITLLMRCCVKIMCRWKLYIPRYGMFIFSVLQWAIQAVISWHDSGITATVHCCHLSPNSWCHSPKSVINMSWFAKPKSVILCKSPLLLGIKWMTVHFFLIHLQALITNPSVPPQTCNWLTVTTVPNIYKNHRSFQYNT